MGGFRLQVLRQLQLQRGERYCAEAAENGIGQSSARGNEEVMLAARRGAERWDLSAITVIKIKGIRGPTLSLKSQRLHGGVLLCAEYYFWLLR